MPKSRTLASLTGRTEDPTKEAPLEKEIASQDRKMSFDERQAIKHEIEMIERSLSQTKEHEDDPRMLRDLYKKKMALAHDDELTFGKGSKAMAEAELKELEHKILHGFNGIPGIPSKNEMWPPTNDMSKKEQAKRHNWAFQCPEMNAVVHRWQELKRRQEPDNPFAQNLDTIRPD
jgi:hypothetical protein